MTGDILRIERTSMYDGGGLRTVVFLKGCPLRCIWCSTPESHSSSPEVAYDSKKCGLCSACINSCAASALSLDARAGKVLIDKDKCRGCFECVSKCLNSARKGYGFKMTSAEVIREIAKDEVFYFHSGGGVTISGGEPLEQSEFVGEVLRGCRDIGINTAVETTFFAAWGRITPLLPLINLLYVDLKHMDGEVHRQITGVHNRVIIENIRRADSDGNSFEMILRIPVVPGVNDSDFALEDMARFAGGLCRVKRVELLAYHRLGTDTYRNLDKEYLLPDIEPPGQEYMLAKANLFKTVSGKSVLINGREI